MPFLGCPGQPDAILQPTEIGHYFCGIFPLLRVASADTDITAALVVAFSGIVSLINFVILCVSHNILLFTLQNHSAGETQTPLCLWASCRWGVSLLAPVSFACLRPPVLTLWTRHLLCFTPSLPLCSTPSSVLWGIQRCRTPWGKFGVKHHFQRKHTVNWESLQQINFKRVRPRHEWKSQELSHRIYVPPTIVSGMNEINKN